MASRREKGRRSFHPDKSSFIPLEATSPLPRHAAEIRRLQFTYFRCTILFQEMSEMTFCITVNKESYYSTNSISGDSEKIYGAIRVFGMRNMGNRVNILILLGHPYE